MNAKTKLRIISGLTLLSISMTHGALVINGDMSSASYATGGNHSYYADLDQGWASKTTGSGAMYINSGVLTWNGSTSGLLQDGLTQVNSVSSETGSVLTVSFDWTPVSGSTTPNLSYQVVGWKVTGSPVAGNEFFRFINGQTKGVSGLNGNAEAIDLLDGSNGGSGNSTPAHIIVNATAGTTVNYSVNLDLSTYGAGYNDIGDYDYIGIRFHIDGVADTTPQGSYLDNVALAPAGVAPPAPPQPLASHDTGYTIQKVRTAEAGTNTIIVGSSYEGSMLGMDYDGTMLWTNELSGYMVHDIWCGDITGDSSDEILVANADGTLYCLNADGQNLWSFKTNEAPMYAVCSLNASGGTKYVVCGGFDKSIYYLSGTGTVLKEIASATYTDQKTWGLTPNIQEHTANFLRPIPQPDNTDHLAVLGTMNHMQSAGAIFQFEAFADLPYSTNKVTVTKTSGDLRVRDTNGDGDYEYLVGSSALGDQFLVHIDPSPSVTTSYDVPSLGVAGYRVTQSDVIQQGGTNVLFVICGTHVKLVTMDLSTTLDEFDGTYAYNDIWKDPAGRILLASAQSGGSAIHIMDPQHATWKSDFISLDPPGKIQTMISNANQVWTNLTTFTKPVWERDPLEVILTSANPNHPVAQDIRANHDSPVFLDYSWSSNAQDPLDWDRNTVLASNPEYRDKRDQRRIPSGESDYIWTQAQVIADILPDIADNGTGLAMWGGHGNDPYYYSLETLKAIIDLQGGDKTVLIWPEMNGSSAAFEMVMNHRFYPLAEYARTNNANIFVRNKNIFWQGAVYLPAWSNIVAGTYSDVFVSGLEETTDKTMEMSVVGRQGMWASGAMDKWGMRCSRDNPSFDRSRQHSYQRLPNHFLRNMVYNLAGGASVLNVTWGSNDYEDYMSLVWELVAEGALFVPQRDEIVSFSPVHLSMTDPDAHYLEDGENNKWTVFYDEAFEAANPFVFSRMNGSWMAAPNTEWDFSRYAAGVKDRRQNFIPPYKNGTVLITPVQEGISAHTNAARGAMTSHLHPMYKNIMQEYITDGRDYISSDGATRYDADTYYTTVSNAIATSASQLPVTVDGDVAWVCAQTSPTNLRLTVVDSGYLNPKARTASVAFNTVTPVSITDVLDGTTYTVSGGTASIDVPLGLFRFIDIKLSEPFFPANGWGEYASERGLTGQSAADSDGDGETDVHEYALGGDAVNQFVLSQKPYLEYLPDNNVSFHHLQVNHTNPGISYIAEWTDNLQTESWNSAWNLDTTVPGVPGSGYNGAERQVYGGTNDHLYIRLKITQP